MTNDIDTIQEDMESKNSEKASQFVFAEHQHDKISGSEPACINPSAEDNSKDEAFGDLCTSQAPKEENTKKENDPEDANEDIPAVNNDYESHDSNAGATEVVVEKEIHQRTKEQRCKEDETTAGMSLPHDNKIQREKTDPRSESEASKSPTLSVDSEICPGETTTNKASLEVIGSEDKFGNPSDVVSEKTIVDEISISTQEVEEMDLLEKQKESVQEKAEVLMLPRIGSEDKIRNPSDAVSETIMAESSTSTQDVEDFFEKQEERFHEKAEVSMLKIVGSEDKVENPSDVISEKTIASNQDAKEMDLLGKQEESFKEKGEVTMLLEHVVARTGTDNPNYEEDDASLQYIKDAEGDNQEESLKDLNSTYAEQIYGTINISNKIEREPSQKLEFVSKSALEDEDQGANMGKQADKIENSLADGSLKRTIPETPEPSDSNENAKDETIRDEYIGNNHDSCLLVEEIVHSAISEKHTEGQSSAYEEQTYQRANLEGIIQGDVSEDKKDTQKLEIPSESLIEIEGQKEIGKSVFTEVDSSIGEESSKMVEIPEIVADSDDSQTVKVKGEDTLEEDISNIPNTGELLQKTTNNGVGEDHKYDNNISNNEDTLITDIDKQKEKNDQLDTESENSEKALWLVADEYQHNKISGLEVNIEPSTGCKSTDKVFGDLCTSQASKEENTQKATHPEEANEDIPALNNDYEGHDSNAGVAQVVIEKEIHQRTEELRCNEDETATGMSLLHDDKIQREKIDTRSELEVSESPTISVDPEIYLDETTTVKASLDVIGSEDKIGNPSDVVSEKTIVDETSTSTQDVEEMDLLEKQKEGFQEKAEVIMLPTIGSEDDFRNPSDAVSETIMAETNTSAQDVEEMDFLEKQEENFHENDDMSMLQIVGSEDKVESPFEVVSEKIIMAETIASNEEAKEMDLLGKQEESLQENVEVTMLLELEVAKMGIDNPSYKADGGGLEFNNEAEGEKQEETPKDLNCTYAEQTYETNDIGNKIERETSQELEFVSKSPNGDEDQGDNVGKQASKIKNSLDDVSLKRTIPETLEPSNWNENAKDETTQNKHTGNNRDSCLLVDEIVHSAINEKHTEGQSSVDEEQTDKSANLEGIIQGNVNKDKKEMEKLGIPSGSFVKIKGQEEMGESVFTEMDNSIDDENSKMMHVVAEQVKDEENLSKAVEEPQFLSHALVFPRPSEPNDENYKESSKSIFEEQCHQITILGEKTEDDVHKERTDSNSLQIIEEKVKAEDALEEDISNTPNSGQLVEKATDDGVGEDHEYDNNITNSEDTIITDINKEKTKFDQLDIQSDLRPEDHSQIVHGDKESIKVEEAPSLENDTQTPTLKQMTNDAESGSRVERNVKEMAYELKYDEILEHISICKNIDEDVQKKEEPLNNFIEKSVSSERANCAEADSGRKMLDEEAKDANFVSIVCKENQKFEEEKPRNTYSDQDNERKEVNDGIKSETVTDEVEVSQIGSAAQKSESLAEMKPDKFQLPDYDEKAREEVQKKHEKDPESSSEDQIDEGHIKNIYLAILKEQDKIVEIEKDSFSMSSEQNGNKIIGTDILQNDQMEANSSAERIATPMEGDDHCHDGKEVSEVMGNSLQDEAKVNDANVSCSSMQSQGMGGDELNMASVEEIEMLESAKKEENTMDHEALDACPSENKLIVAAKVKHLYQQKIKIEERTLTEAKIEDSNLLSQEVLERTNGLSTVEALFEGNMPKSTSTVLSGNQSHDVPGHINVEEMAVLEKQNEEMQKVQAHLFDEVENEKKEEENNIQTEQIESETMNTNDTAEEERQISKVASDKAKPELETPLHEVPKGLKTVSGTENIYKDRIETQNLEGKLLMDENKMLIKSAIESEGENQTNEPIHDSGSIECAIPHEEIVKAINTGDEVAKVVVQYEASKCHMVDSLYVSDELFEETVKRETSVSHKQMTPTELESLEKGGEISTQNDEITETSAKLDESSRCDTKEPVQLEAPSSTVSNLEKAEADMYTETKIEAKEDAFKSTTTARVGDINANEQFQEEENESKKDKEPEANRKPDITDSTPKDEVEKCDSKLAQIGLSEKTEKTSPIDDEDLIKSLRAENAKQEIAEKFGKIADYKPIGCTEQTCDANELGIELPKEKGSPAEIEKLMHIAGDTASVPEIHVNDGKVPDDIPCVLSVCEPSREDIVLREDSVNPTEFSNLLSDEEDREDSSSVEVTGSKKISHKMHAMPDPELQSPEKERERLQLEEEASCEAVEFSDLQDEKKQQAEGTNLPVSRLLMDHILSEEKVKPDKACDVGAEDNTLHDGGEQHDAGMPKEERILVTDETSISRHSVGPDEFQTTPGKFESENKIHEKLDEGDQNGARTEKEILVSFSPENATGKTSISEDNIGQEKLETCSPSVEENQVSASNEKTEIPVVKDDVKPKNSPHDSSSTILMSEDVKDASPSLTEISACGDENDSREPTLTGKRNTEKKLDIEDCILPVSVQNEKVQGTVLEKYPKEQTNKKIDEVLNSDVLPLVLDASHEDSLLEEGSKEGKAILQDVRKMGKASYEVLEGQYPSNAETVGETKSLVHNKETLPNPEYDQNGKSSSNLKGDLHGQTSELESEVKMVENENEDHDGFTGNQVPHEKKISTGKTYLSELQEVDQSNLAVKSTDQTLEVAKNLPDGKILALHTDEQVAVGITEAQADEDNSEGENDEYKPEESGNDARVVVEARDADLKPAHKKSHNILSGVGSKFKHSLSKVKKVITGKSSHSKTSPAK